MLLAGNYSDTVLAMDPKTLAPKELLHSQRYAAGAQEGAGVAAAGVTPMVFPWGGKDVLLVGGRDERLYLLDAASLGRFGSPHTPLARKTEPIVAPDTDFNGNGIWSTFSTYENETDKTRWVYASIHGQAAIKVPGSNASASNGSIVAFKVVDQGASLRCRRSGSPRDMISPEGDCDCEWPGVRAVDGRVGAHRNKKDGTPLHRSRAGEDGQRHAVLYILDGTTGQELFSGSDATSFAHSGIAIANGRVYFSTHDNTLFVYGLPQIR